MKIETLSQKVGEYVRTVLAARASGWAAKCVLGGASVVASRRVPEIAAAAGAVGQDGEVDMDVLHAVVMAGFETAGHVDVLGGMLGFDPPDAEDLFAWLRTST